MQSTYYYKQQKVMLAVEFQIQISKERDLSLLYVLKIIFARHTVRECLFFTKLCPELYSNLSSCLILHLQIYPKGLCKLRGSNIQMITAQKVEVCNLSTWQLRLAYNSKKKSYECIFLSSNAYFCA